MLDKHKKNANRMISRVNLIKKLEQYKADEMLDSDEARKISYQIARLDSKIGETTPVLVNELETTIEKLSRKLNAYTKWDALNCKDAQEILNEYKSMCERYTAIIGNQPLNMFNPDLIQKETLYLVPISTQKSCQVCGFPLTKALDGHHLIPQNLEPKTGHVIKVCKNCHKIIHRCGDLGKIENEVLDYYSSLDSAIDMLSLCASIIWDIRESKTVKPIIIPQPDQLNKQKSD